MHIRVHRYLEQGNFVAVIDDTLHQPRNHCKTLTEINVDETAWHYSNKAFSGQRYQAVQHLTLRDTGATLNPNGIDEKMQPHSS